VPKKRTQDAAKSSFTVKHLANIQGIWLGHESAAKLVQMGVGQYANLRTSLLAGHTKWSGNPPREQDNDCAHTRCLKGLHEATKPATSEVSAKVF